MTEKKKKRQIPKGWAVNVLIISGIFLIIYVAIVHIAIPLYTRHSQSVPVPNVTRLSLQAAEKLLDANHLVAVQGEFRYDDEIPRGLVIFQNPDVGRNVKKGRRIYLTISMGSRRVKMPDLVGKSERDVRFVLERLKLKIGQVSYEFDNFFPNGVVIDQTIDQDMEVEIGTPVDLLVSFGEEPIDFFIPDLIGQDLENTKLMMQKARLTLGKVQSQTTNKISDGTVIWQSKEAGMQAAEGDTVDIILSRGSELQEGDVKW